ncbi:MAG: hypothetical protein EBU49_14840, partial [Proteobacteria bacterium]|nr:hypothetical protein [Pseudomonadota bacterium]
MQLDIAKNKTLKNTVIGATSTTYLQTGEWTWFAGIHLGQELTGENDNSIRLGLTWIEPKSGRDRIDTIIDTRLPETALGWSRSARNNQEWALAVQDRYQSAKSYQLNASVRNQNWYLSAINTATQTQ